MQVNKVFNPIVYVFGLDKIVFLKVWEMGTLLHSMLQLLSAFAERPLDKKNPTSWQVGEIDHGKNL